MPAGKPTALYVEIEFSAGVWTDVTGYVPGGAVMIQQGRSSATDSVQPGVLTFALDNSDGTFTPDNPLSTYYPNVVEGKRVRVRVTKSSTVTRFLGTIVELVPDYPQAPEDAVVQVTAVDALGTLERRTLRPLVTEYVMHLNTLGSVVGYFPLTDPDGATSAAPGVPGGAFTRMGQRGGVAGWGDATGIATDGASTVSLEAGVSLSASAPSMPSVRETALWFSCPDGAYGTLFRLRGSGSAEIKVSVGSDGYLRARRVTEDGTVDLDGSVAYGTKVNDGGVHFVQWTDGTFPGPININELRLDDVVLYEDYTPTEAGIAVRSVTLGPPTVGSLGLGHLLLATSNSFVAGEVYGLAKPSAGVMYQADRLGHLYDWTGVSASVTGSDRIVTAIATEGKTALEVMQYVANGESGRMWQDNTTGYITIGPAASAAPSTVALTVDVEDDAIGGVSVARASSALVGSVVAENGATSVTVTDADVDSTATATVGLVAADVVELEAAASRRIAQGKYQRLRIARVTLDLATAENNRYADFWALTPGSRVRDTNLPSSHFGVTYMDGFVEGWVEEIDLAGYRVTFDLSAADAPAASVFNTGRFGWGDGVCTASSLTSSATSVTLTWTGGAALSTSAGDYPMDLDINGERVTVSAAPGGSSSPQTVTIVRGVAPTVARAHSAGDAVDVWDVARFTY